MSVMAEAAAPAMYPKGQAGFCIGLLARAAAQATLDTLVFLGTCLGRATKVHLLKLGINPLAQM